MTDTEQFPPPECAVAIIADDGRVLVEANDYGNIMNAKGIYPKDIVGSYEADTIISSDDFTNLCIQRKKMGKEVSDEDLRRLPIPLRNLSVGSCVDIFGTTSQEEFDRALKKMDDRFMRHCAAELAVRRELRDKRIGIDPSQHEINCAKGRDPAKS